MRPGGPEEDLAIIGAIIAVLVVLAIGMWFASSAVGWI